MSKFLERRNLLKLLGLLPFGFLPKVKAEEYRKCSERFPDVSDRIGYQEPKYYATVQITYSGVKFRELGTKNEYWQAYVEVELEDGCKPRPNQYAYVVKDGKVSSTFRGMGLRTRPNEICIGVFTSERYTKDATKSS